jgi:hypothetical protein
MEGGWSLHSPLLARIHEMLLHTAAFLDDSSGKPIPHKIHACADSSSPLVLRDVLRPPLFWYCFSSSANEWIFVRNLEFIAVRV